MEAYFHHGKQYIKKVIATFLLTIFLYEIQHMKLTLEVVIVSFKIELLQVYTTLTILTFLFYKILQLWFFSPSNSDFTSCNTAPPPPNI